MHGLCTFGYAARHVLATFCYNDPLRFKAIKGRFTKHVFPGETIQTEMWKMTDEMIAFQVRVLDRNEIILANAAVQIGKGTMASPITKEPSSSKTAALFERFKQVFYKLPDAVRREHVKKIGGIFQFDIDTGGGRIETFYMDLKNGAGDIGAGKAKGAAADITVMVGDANFVDLAGGKLKGQAAFMKGLLKVKGNMMLAMKLDGLLRTLMGGSGSSKL